MSNGIRDRIGKAWSGLGGENQAGLISGGISALGGMISGGEDRDDALARDAYARQLAAFNALQQNPYSQAMALQRANNMRAFLERGGRDASAISPEALAAARGQWEGERQGVRGTGFHPEDQQKKGGGFWNKLGKIGLGIGSVALPMVTGGLSLPAQAAIGAGMGAAGGALGGGGASGAAKGAALGAGGGLLGGWLRGGGEVAKGATKPFLPSSGGLLHKGQLVARQGFGGSSPIANPFIKGLVGQASSFPENYTRESPSGGPPDIQSPMTPRQPYEPNPPMMTQREDTSTPNALHQFDVGEEFRVPRWTGGLPEGMEFNPVSPPSPPDRSREMPQTARDATVYPSGWGQGPTRADNPATYSSAQPRGYGDTSRGLPEGMDFTPVSPPPPFDLSQVPSPPVQGLVPKIQGRSAGPPPPPWSLSQEAGITPSRSLMGRPPVVPGAWQGSPQSPLPINQPARLPGRDPRYEVPQVRPFYPSGMMPQRELGLPEKDELIQMYLNTLSPADKAAFLQRLAQEGGR